MPPSVDAGERKIPRRRFIKLAGVIAAAGLTGIVLGNEAGRQLGDKSTENIVEPTNQTSAAATTVTDVRTLTNTQTETETLTNTQIDTETDTQTETDTLTDTQTDMTTETDTETVTDTQVETVTSSQTETAATSTTSPSSASVSFPPPPNSFSIFWITDTQFLSETNPALFGSLTNWIVENWGAYNGKVVIHTGDIVETGAVPEQWQNADAAMSNLLQNGIPYTWCAGNHDDLVGGDPTSGWNGNIWAPSFDPTQVSAQVNAMQGVSWVGDFHNGMNTALAFSANGLDFLVVNLEWNAQPDVLAWVGGILDDPDYSDHHVIIAPHAYMNAWGFPQVSSDAIDLSGFVGGITALMDAHSSNVFLTLNGHFATDFGYNLPSPVNGRNELMFDRQDSTDAPGDPIGHGVDPDTPTTTDDEKVGGATVTILNFDTANNQINVSTCDVYTGLWRADPYEQYSITLFPTLTAINPAGVAGRTTTLTATK
ncbi:MAG: metallophosphoesterase [Thaumarchaeota archaeon]|nr:metallophosphoesterase [Nitrososphaerota archaeon]